MSLNLVNRHFRMNEGVRSRAIMMEHDALNCWILGKPLFSRPSQIIALMIFSIHVDHEYLYLTMVVSSIFIRNMFGECTMIIFHGLYPHRPSQKLVNFPNVGCRAMSFDRKKWHPQHPRTCSLGIKQPPKRFCFRVSVKGLVKVVDFSESL